MSKDNDVLLSENEYISTLEEEIRMFKLWLDKRRAEGAIPPDPNNHQVNEQFWTDQWNEFVDADFSEEDAVMTSTATSADSLDNTPLTFGKYKGRTPRFVADQCGESGREYIRWMYRDVINKPTCSYELYKTCGGYGKDHNAPAPTAAPKPSYFYDMDDDIPF